MKGVCTALRSVAGFLAFGAATPALAGGYYLHEQSPKEIGRAGSGGAAAADDPSTLVSNPAGMVRLPGVQMSVGGALLDVDVRQTDRGTAIGLPGSSLPLYSSPIAVPGPGFASVGGGDGGNPFKPVSPLPSGFVTAQVGERLWLGLGVSSPFGLSLEYARDFFGRYESLKTSLKTINIQPSAAFAVNDWLSVGGGVDVQYAKATLSSAYRTTGDFTVLEGLVRTTGEDWSVGWNAGILMQRPGIRAGLHYRSGIRHTLKGEGTIPGTVLLPIVGSPPTAPVTAPLALPDLVTASLAADIGPKARLMATARFFNWSVVKETRVERIPMVFVRMLSYKDSYSLSLGGEYDVDDRLTLRAGAMYDATPITPEMRTTRIPDGDRRWLSAGATYALTPHVAVNLSYAHVFIETTDIDRTEGLMILRARTRGNVDMLAASLSARF